MALNSTTTKVSYAGDDADTSFPITFVFWDNSDIEAVLVDDATGAETTWVEATNYTLSGGDGSTGTLTATAAPATGETLVIRSNRANTQPTELPLGGRLPSTSVERALDQTTRLVQQRGEETGRALKAPVAESSIADIPTSASRANKVFTFDANGDPQAQEIADIDSSIDTLLTSLAANDMLAFDGSNWVNKTAAQVRTLLALGTMALETAADYVPAVQAFEDVASATTTDIGAASSRNVRITGTTTITGLGTVAAGTFRRVRFAAALTLTHNGTSLILPGTANITTAADDTATFVSLGSGNWLCLSYKRATGLPVAFVDEDDMSSDSAVKVPSQQSVKAYVDTETLTEGALLDTSSGTSANTSSLGKTSPKVIHLAFDAVSVDGTDDLLIQIGPSGGVETSGYSSDGASIAGGGNTVTNSTAGFIIDLGAAARAVSGTATLVNVTGNVWDFSYSGRTAANVVATGGGRKSLAGALTQITAKPSGSDNFDGGQIRIRSL